MGWGNDFGIGWGGEYDYEEAPVPPTPVCDCAVMEKNGPDTGCAVMEKNDCG